MEHDFGYSRTWQSLKERFRMRIMTNLSTYIPAGLDPDDMELLREKVGIREGPRRRKSRIEFSYDEDLTILHFISINHRHSDVGGVLLWQEMESKCNELRHHTWSSIKNRFMKKILPNITAYGLTKEEVLQFQSKRGLREHERKLEEKSHRLLRRRRITVAAGASQSMEKCPSYYQNRPNKLPPTKKSRPVHGDSHPPVTPPRESCQVLPQSEVASSRAASFIGDSIDYTLNRSVDKEKETKQRLSTVTQEEEKESSQDEPTTMRQLIVQAEVHREMMQEDVTQRIMTTKGKHLLPNSTIEDEEEEEREEETEEILVEEEITEETEVMGLETETVVAEELSQEKITSEEEELQVQMHVDLPKNTHMPELEEKMRTPPTQHNSPSILQPDPPRRVSTVAHILESHSSTSDTTVDIVSLTSKRKHFPEHRRRGGKDSYPPSSAYKVRNKLRKWIIRR